MKIAILTLSHRPHDPRVFGKFACTLTKAGHEVTILCPSTDDMLKRNGITFIKVAPFNGQFADGMGLIYAIRLSIRRIKALYEMGKLVKSINPELYICTEPDTWFLGMLLKLINGGVLIYDIHELYPIAFSHSLPIGILRISFLAILKSIYYIGGLFTDLSIHVSYDRMQWHKFMPGKKIIVWNYPRNEEVNSALSRDIVYSSKTYTLIHSGPLDLVRGRENILGAIKQIGKRGIHISLLVVGKSNNPHQIDLMRRVADLGLSDYVDELPWVSHEESLALIRRAMVGIALNEPYQENLRLAVPQKLFEYMAIGIPSITTAGPTVSPIILDAGCGLLIKDNKVSELVDAILRILMHEDESKRMGIAGHRKFLSKYNWDNESRILINAIRELETKSIRSKTPNIKDGLGDKKSQI